MVSPATIRRCLLLVPLVAGCGGSAPPAQTTPVVHSPEEDADGDGVADAFDRCASDHEDRDGFFDHDGCPDPDDDADGIVDGCDSCPREPGRPQGDGCPDVPATGERRAELLTYIPFASDSGRLSVESLPALLELSRALRAEIHIERVALVGLAGEGEPDPEHLSTERAEHVRTFLVAHGVDPARLVARGFGTKDPLPVTPPWPAAHAREAVWFVVERAAGSERYVLEDDRFVQRETAPLGPRPRTTPPRAGACSPATR